MTHKLIYYAISLWPVILFAALPIIYWLSLISDKIKNALPLTLYLGSAIIIIFAIASISYFFSLRYVDHVEPAVVVSALNAYRGLLVFPDWELGEGAYGLPYGPMLDLVVGAPLLFSKTVLASKAAACAAFWFSLMMFLVIGRHYSDVESEWFIVQYYWLVFLSIGYFAFFVRSEPFLMALSASGAALVARSPQTRLRWLALGLLAGFATAFKAHAFLYFAPLIAFALTRMKDARSVVVPCLLGLAGAALALAISFLADWGTLTRFIKYNIIMGHEGFQSDLFGLDVLTALALLAPFRLSLRSSGVGLTDNFALLLTVTVTLFTVAIFTLIGSKIGSGPPHLMPLAPPLLVLTSEVLKALPFPQQSSSVPSFNILHAAMCVAFVAPTLVIVSSMRSLLADAETDQALYTEASKLSKRYPAAEFGPTDGANYKFVAYRVAPALAGGLQTFSVVYWMDLAYIGVDPLKFEPHFRKPASEWILPNRGEPFALPSLLTNATLFPAIRSRFPEVCRIVEGSANFNVWRCDAPLAPG